MICQHRGGVHLTQGWVLVYFLVPTVLAVGAMFFGMWLAGGIECP